MKTSLFFLNLQLNSMALKFLTLLNCQFWCSIMRPSSCIFVSLAYNVENFLTSY